MAVLKTIMLTGVSEQGWTDAVHTALEEAAETIEGIEWMDIKRYSARIEDNRIKEYRAVVKVTFKVERHKH